MNFFAFIMAIYFINLFFGLKLLFTTNLNFPISTYSLISIIVFPFLTPFIYIFSILNEQFKKQLIKKRLLDIKNLPELNNRSLTKHNDSYLFTNGEKLFDDIFTEIKKANHFIHISILNFNTDKIGKSFIKILEEKLKENVEVIIMYDKFGSTQQKKYLSTFKRLGGEIIPFIKSNNNYFNFKYRNHRKFIIIDNKIAYIGGFNIGDKYLGRNKKYGLWIDSEIKIIGSIVSEIEKRFLVDYMYCKKKKIPYKQYLIQHNFTGNKQIEFISCGADISEINYSENKIIQYIYNAKKHIYIQTPYLIINDNFISALKYAKSNNVDIKIMLPNKSNTLFFSQATKAYASQLIKDEIEIYLFNKNAFINSKVFICDDYYVSIGTSNMDIRSFKYNLECNAFIYDRSFAQYVKEVFIKQIPYCKSYTKKQLENQTILEKIYYNTCKLISSIL